MWIFAKSGFYSIVEDALDRSRVLVRARRREDLAALRLGAKIIETPDADYGFRCRVNKKHWARKLLKLSIEIDYSNFKDAVPERKHLYGDVWLTMRDLQEPPLLTVQRAVAVEQPQRRYSMKFRK